MFGKGKRQENQFVIAVKDLANTERALESGQISLPYEKSLYRELMASSSIKADNLRDLKKFIKKQSKNKGEVKHYWESLILQGYTLMEVNYEKKMPPIEKLCNAGNFKLVCRV